MTDVTRRLNTAFSRTIRDRAARAVREYGMIAPGDRIAVCVSGGKDSMLLALVLQELAAHGGTPFTLRFLGMDPGYAPESRARLIENARRLGLSLHLFETDVFRVAVRHAKNPCFLCAKMRRGHLYQQAQSLGCNKIALGHHYDDVVETILMGMVYGGQVQTMLPRLQSAHFAGMELIRPLYQVREADIVAFFEPFGLSFLDCACPARARTAGASKRAEIRRMIERLCQDNPQIKQNIFNSVRRIDLRHVLGWTDGHTESNYMEIYNR